MYEVGTNLYLRFMCRLMNFCKNEKVRSLDVKLNAYASFTAAGNCLATIWNVRDTVPAVAQKL